MPASPELVRFSMWPFFFPTIELSSLHFNGEFRQSTLIVVIEVNNVIFILYDYSFSPLPCLLWDFSSFLYSSFFPLVFWKFCNLFLLF